jgi:hypothetical protein
VKNQYFIHDWKFIQFFVHFKIQFLMKNFNFSRQISKIY